MGPDISENTIWKRLWAEFIIALEKGNYTPVPNRNLDRRIADKSLTDEVRLDALLERKTVGNWGPWACERERKTGRIIKFLGQQDFAEITGIDKRRVNEWAQMRARQGYLQLGDGQNPHLLILVYSPRGGSERAGQEEAPVPWGEFSRAWLKEHPAKAELLEKTLKLREPLDKTITAIRLEIWGEYRKLKRQPSRAESAAADGSSGESPAQPTLDFDETGPPVPDFLESGAFGPSPDSPDKKSGVHGQSGAHKGFKGSKQ